MPTKEEMIALIDRMDKHRQSGGSPFECPSMTAPPEQKRELQKAINAVWVQETNKWDQALITP